MLQYIRDHFTALYLTDANGNPTQHDLLDPAGVSLLTGSTPAFQVPNTFATNQWSVATGTNPAEINITISVLPANNGSAITAIQYRVGTGAWVALPDAATGTYPVTMPATSTPYSISLRAINIVGPSAQSAAKTATSGAPAATAPAAFGPAQWTLATGTEPATLALNILTLPADGGSAITALEYRVGSGEWLALTGTDTGPRTITMEAASTAYTVAIRAVNSVGAGNASAGKTATSAAPAQVAPAVQTPPTITGNTSVGSILTRTAGTATGVPTPTRATQWLRNGTVLSGQTANSLDTTGFAADDVITTRDVWTNTGGTATGTSEAVTLAAENLQPLTYQVSPDPIAAGQPYSVTFSAIPDSTTGLTGTGLTRTGTAPASGNAAFTAAKAGHVPVNASLATVPAVAPAASGGDIQWDGDTVTLVPPSVTAGYPDPEVTLTSLTIDDVDVTGDLDNETLPNITAQAAAQVIEAVYTIANGVSPNATVTLTETIPAAAITAVSEPTTARLYAGQTAAAIPDIATATNTANYASTGGAIVSAQLQVNGADATTSTVLAISDVVSVLVTDDDGLTRRWVLSTVEYALRIAPESGGSYRSVEINDLIPGAQSVSLTWDGATISTSRNALEAGPVNHVAPVIALEGETFSVTGNGLWWNSSTGGVPTYAYQWLRDGANIPGAQSATYTRGGSDAGTETTVRVTATDTNGPGQAVSNAIENPAAPAATVAYVDRAALSGATSAPRTFAARDLGAPAANRDILVLAQQANTPGATVSSVTVGGVAATRVQVNVGGTLQNGVASTATGLAYISLWKARVPTGATGDVVVTYSGTTSACFITLIRGEDLASVQAFGAGVNATSVSATLTGGTAGRKAFGASLINGGVAVDWSNGSEIFDEDPLAQTRWTSLAETTVGGDGTVTMTATRVSGGGSQTALIVFSAGA